MKKRGAVPYQDILEDTGLLMIGIDSEGRIVLFNTALEKASGYSRDEVIGRRFWEFFIPDETRDVDRVLLDSFRKGELIASLEQIMQTRDGGRRLVSWRSTIVGAGKGRSGITVSVGMDITERRLAEEALASSEGFFRMLIEKSLDLVTVLDAEARIVYAGPSVERLLGYRQEEIIGRNIMEFIHPDEKEAARAALDFAFARPGVTGDIEVRIRNRDGDWRIHEATSYNLLENPMVGGIVINSRDVTDRRAVEEELRRTSYELEHVMQALPDLYFRFSPDGTVVDYRAGREANLYAPPLEFMGRKVWEVLPAEMREVTERSIREVSRGGGPAAFEYDMSFPEGMRRYEARLLPAFEGEVIAVVRDITERSWAARLLQVQRDLAIKMGGSGELQEVLEAALSGILEVTGLDSGGIYLFDPETGDLELKCHHGLTQEFVSKTSRYDTGSENVRIVMAGVPIYVDYDELEVPLADTAGDEGLKAFAAVPIKSEGKVIGSLNLASHSFVEISERIREALEILAGQIGRVIERAALIASLRESEEGYRVTFESTGSAMILLGLDGTILDGNQEIQRLLGYSKEEVAGRMKYMDFVHPDDLALVKRHSINLLKGEARGPVRYEARTVRRDGRVLNTIINVSMLPGMDKSVASIVDITDKKSYELELEARAAQLRDFLDVAAHELRHPATLIEGYAMTLDKYGTEMSREDLKASLAAIVRGVDKLTGVVDDLLDLSRIERGFMSLERGEYALLPLIRSAAGEMTARAGDNPIEVTHHDDPGKVRLDAEKFTRLMVILLDNAVKYSPPASPVEVNLDRSGAEAVVAVMDRGRGIPERERSRIFDRFYQAEEVLHHSSPGLGLGLYIAKRIVEAHGGRIWCEPREGGGSVFRFTLPLRD